MKSPIGLAAVLFLSACASCSGQERNDQVRRFRFTYDVSITGLSDGDVVRCWIPEPAGNEYQKVAPVHRQLPGESMQQEGEQYGNHYSFFTLTADSDRDLNASMSWDIQRRKADPLRSFRSELVIPDSVQKKFLAANRLVPVGGATMKALGVTNVPENPIDRGEYLFELVSQHMKYDKSQPGYGNGDALWACESRFGNCTDFHSLFISLARATALPARFEIGFSIPRESGEQQVGGYHCWGWFLASGQWIPVDISEYDKYPQRGDNAYGKLSADRVAFTTGRDLVLQPPQQSEPLNYFIYPHVEVNGKAWPREQVVTRFTSQSK